ncbi:hypothetical protein M1439_01740 [Candidatus Marsarchaeota archaeon]|jgi:hypothetical protein|nr:hypothetical protein [Candidatus Marsarchaeota archaeon]MCL5092253.1 hypothetical protein [Candidatus Marsarchaeota archaeon]
MITGFTISKVEGTIASADALSKQRFPKLNVNLDNVSSKGDKINVEYTFMADYSDGEEKSAKSVGQIKLGGTIEISESKEATAAVLKRWNENHTLPVNLAEEVINGLNFRCSATGTLVAYSLGLIPPLVISQTKIQEEPKK